MLFLLATPCFAASGLNAAEQQVLKMMDKGVKYNEDFYQYKNALKVYFNRDNIAITQIQADYACQCLVDLYDKYTAETVDETTFFDAFIEVMRYLRVRGIYNRATSTADFFGSDGSIVFSELKLKNIDGKRAIELEPIKQTGSDGQALWIGVCGIGMAVAALTLMIIVKKKGKLHG